MGVRHPRSEELKRLELKTLDAQFKTTVQDGLSCSRFEAEAVLDVVREVYQPYMDDSPGRLAPGRISLVAVGADDRCGLGVLSQTLRVIRDQQ